MGTNHELLLWKAPFKDQCFRCWRTSIERAVGAHSVVVDAPTFDEYLLEALSTQLSRVATSRDGIHFEAREEILGRSYMRAFQHDGMTYAIAMPGQFYRSKDGLQKFEQGPLLFNTNMRHAALLKRDETLYVFWTRVGDTPERILLSKIDLSEDWADWSPSEPVEVLRPEQAWEGANAPLEPSVRSVAYGKVNQLRDPAIYVEGERSYILYAVAGESGIAIAELKFSR